MLSQAQEQESQCGNGRRRFMASEEDQGCQAWKRRRLDHGNNSHQLTFPSQYSPDQTFYPVQANKGIQYHENWDEPAPLLPPVHSCVNIPNGEGQYLKTSPDNHAFLDCCYGMISAVPVRVKQAAKNVAVYPKRIPVAFNSANLLSWTHNEELSFEIPDSSIAKILSELGVTDQLHTQLYCYSKIPYNEKRKTNSRRIVAPSWFLNIILYGPPVLEDSIGQFFSERHINLQDPLSCDRRVVYRNPHILRPEDGHEIMTDGIESSLGNLEIERLEEGPNLLAKLMEDEVPLAGTEAPSIIKSSPFPHQKQALTFMLRRERGWAMDEAAGDIWTRRSGFGSRYRNNVTGVCQDVAPAPFQGGLLADDMGLGKTLSMICLIAANQAQFDLTSPTQSPGPPRRHGRQVNVKTTLLIVPPPLIQSWQKQLQIHLIPGKLQVYVLHGQNKIAVDMFRHYDIIITTYQTVASIWRKQLEEREDVDSIFSVNWHRIILDEAHTIQNPESHLAQSCCALRSFSRWAITGTPIQNKLMDFASIVKFLQVYPYSEIDTFNHHILQPWRRGDGEGFLRLKTLVRAITISRTKKVVRLAPREDFIHHLDFAPEELELYDDVKKQSVPLIRSALSSFQGRRVNALQHLNRLRLICSHGRLAQDIYRGSEALQSQNPPLSDPRMNIQASFVGDALSGNSACTNCGRDLLEDLLEGPPSANMNSRFNFAQRSNELCGQCIFQTSQAGFGRWCSDDLLEVPCTPPSQSPTPSPKGDSPFAPPIELMPTKIKALVTDLAEHSPREKSVVFSYWTYTLDLVQVMLDSQGIAYTRIDGSTSLPKRSKAMSLFQKVDSWRVILVSITCGGAGLDLTAASRAYLLEPHWNPMIEEQALCRVHRVGQSRPVTTIRYLMRNSFEEQVVEIQKRKKLLARVTFGRDAAFDTNIDVGILEYLGSVLE